LTEPQNRKKGVIKVKLLRGNRVIRSYKVQADTFTIGSAPGCTVRAAGDPSVAPKHAILYIEEGELILVPEQGAVVFLNGEEVDFAVPSPEDVIKIGRLNFQVALVDSMDSFPPGRVSRAPQRRAVAQAGTVPTAQQGGGMASPKGRSQARPEVARPQARPVGRPQPSAQAPRPQPRARQRAVPIEPKPKVPDRDTPIHGVNPVAVAATRGRVSAPPPARRASSIAPPDPRPSPSLPMTLSSQPGPIMAIPMADARMPETAYVPPEQFATDDDETRTVASTLPTVVASLDSGVMDGGQTAFTDEETAYYLSDDEEDEETFEEAFDLANLLLEGTKLQRADDGPKESYCAAHVIRIKNGNVVDTSGVTPESPYTTPYGEVECFIAEKTGKGQAAEIENIILNAARHVCGIVTVRGERRALNTSEGTGMVSIMLQDGDSATLTGYGGTYKIEAYRPPLAPKKVPLLSMSPVMLTTVIVIALILHAAAAYALRYFDVATLDDFLEEEEEVFAEVKLKQPEKKPPEPMEPEEVVQEEADAKSIAERAPKVSRRQVRKVKEQPKSAVNNLLNILSRGSGKEGKSNKLKDLISNIDAVAATPGKGSFSIAGAIASLPGSGVNIAKSGGGGIISTLSGDQVAGSGSGIASIGKVQKKGKVRGKVTKMSTGVKVGGSLSRADVLKVINKHFHAVQACYERALMQTPNLSGRIAFDWTVSTSGSVKGVRVRSSTLGNPKVANCISSLIKRWKFPRPKGGEAVITFPFLFRVGS
jgi:outer membrane biosynthesis protein TonB